MSVKIINLLQEMLTLFPNFKYRFQWTGEYFLFHIYPENAPENLPCMSFFYKTGYYYFRCYYRFWNVFNKFEKLKKKVEYLLRILSKPVEFEL